MDVAEWLKRLEDNFSAYGMVGGHLLEVIEMERAYGEQFVATFHGHSVLMDSFQSFFIETLRSVQAWVQEHGWPAQPSSYATVFFYYVTALRSFRACQNLLLHGYPLDGYARFRDLKDRAVLLGGLAHNLTTFAALTALEHNDRVCEERRVRRLIVGKDSGLDSVDREVLRDWEQLFNREVHGAMLSFITELGDWARGERSISIGPTLDERSVSMYMNRAVEVGWLFTRLLPYLQPAKGAFGTEWETRLSILDDSFRISEQALADLDKKIGAVFIKLVYAKFSFPADFCYFEADGTSTPSHS